MPMAGSTGVGIAQGANPTGKRIDFRKKSRFMKALFSCPCGTMPEKNGEYHRLQTLDNLLPAMQFNPLYNGRPRREVMCLLLCAPSAMKFYNQAAYLTWGLVTMEPMVCNRRKARSRLSYVGLELLDHWAKHFPKFKPFVDAYVTKKARKEIAIDAVGYKMGIAPSRFIKMKELHERETALNRDTPTRRKFQMQVAKMQNALLAQQHMDYLRSMQSAQTANNILWGQQLSTAQQQALHHANLNSQPITSAVYTGPAPTGIASGSSYIGTAVSKIFGRK